MLSGCRGWGIGGKSSGTGGFASGAWDPWGALCLLPSLMALGRGRQGGLRPGATLALRSGLIRRGSLDGWELGGGCLELPGRLAAMGGIGRRSTWDLRWVGASRRCVLPGWSPEGSLSCRAGETQKGSGPRPPEQGGRWPPAPPTQLSLPHFTFKLPLLSCGVPAAPSPCAVGTGGAPYEGSKRSV